MAIDPQKYVDRLPDPGWERELKKANHRKNGHPIKYPDSLFARMAIFKACTGAPYRALEGMCRESLGHAGLRHTRQDLQGIAGSGTAGRPDA